MAAGMSRTGHCWDNAVAESFFGTFKTELTAPTRYATHAAAIGNYVESFYNLQRRHSPNDRVSPIEYEARSLDARLAAQSYFISDREQAQIRGDQVVWHLTLSTHNIVDVRVSRRLALG
jgi:hypothetical protein